jgi:hypothetical protein
MQAKIRNLYFNGDHFEWRRRRAVAIWRFTRTSRVFHSLHRSFAAIQHRDRSNDINRNMEKRSVNAVDRNWLLFRPIWARCSVCIFQQSSTSSAWPCSFDCSGVWVWPALDKRRWCYFCARSAYVSTCCSIDDINCRHSWRQSRWVQLQRTALWRVAVRTSWYRVIWDRNLAVPSVFYSISQTPLQHQCILSAVSRLFSYVLFHSIGGDSTK